VFRTSVKVAGKTMRGGGELAMSVSSAGDIMGAVLDQYAVLTLDQPGGPP
jgi:hypothetical protein